MLPAWEALKHTLTSTRAMIHAVINTTTCTAAPSCHAMIARQRVLSLVVVVVLHLNALLSLLLLS